jgi:galactokinase
MHEDVFGPVRILYENTFGTPAVMTFAPGRANIIGEHTDYNEGFVLPFAIEQGLYFFAGLAQDEHCTLLAADTGERWSFKSYEHPDENISWSRYICQSLKEMQYTGKGFNIVFGGDLPDGAGISSSSALTCGFIRTLSKLSGLFLTNREILHLAVTAEIGSGVKGGMMDQFTIINALKDHTILLDCKSLSARYVPFDPETFRFLLINTNIKHNLADTDYNNRRTQCDESVEILKKVYPDIQSLRDVPSDWLTNSDAILPPLLSKRVQHVISENQRVSQMAEALRNKDVWQAGTLLYQSHQSLSLLYEVSCPELDFLVSWASGQSNIYGARMMGGGFGGCTINLIENELSEDQKATLFSSYKAEFGHYPTLIPICSGPGMS